MTAMTKLTRFSWEVLAYNLAVMIAKEKPAEALALSRKASELKPDEPKYAFTYAYFQSRKGDSAGAVKTLEALYREILASKGIKV